MNAVLAIVVCLLFLLSSFAAVLVVWEMQLPPKEEACVVSEWGLCIGGEQQRTVVSGKGACPALTQPCQDCVMTPWSVCNPDNLTHTRSIVTPTTGTGTLACGPLSESCSYVIGTYPSSPRWTVVLSNVPGSLVDVGAAVTNDLFAKTMMLKVECTDCDAANATVYYKRITPMGSLSLYNLIKTWTSSLNMLNVDFELYSSWEDVKAGTNKWKTCNYDDAKTGMFRDCAPVAAKGLQWWSSSSDPFYRANTRHKTFSIMTI